MVRRRLLRAREAFAQMVRMVIQSASKSVSKSVSELVCRFDCRGAGKNAQPAENFAPSFDVEMNILVFSRRGELRAPRRELSNSLPQPGVSAPGVFV